ncbi:RHS repeat-associated core domain-containing protein [Flavobacterium amniphilum]|uniref:DUF6443 domain-containing protein n=1 Tax=Flavobacterium amniphilum TaxID=1834035 RepID=UPI00202A8664|nr:DUF6443 domain-containing protein [Flavobacterium amniphilum]MCL9803987.1 RHS repeat-associated core domain-containing protein [Flavobacterium amniphilum]
MNALLDPAHQGSVNGQISLTINNGNLTFTPNYFCVNYVKLGYIFPIGSGANLPDIELGTYGGQLTFSIKNNYLFIAAGANVTGGSFEEPFSINNVSYTYDLCTNGDPNPDDTTDFCSVNYNKVWSGTEMNAFLDPAHQGSVNGQIGITITNGVLVFTPNYFCVNYIKLGNIFPIGSGVTLPDITLGTHEGLTFSIKNNYLFIAAGINVTGGSFEEPYIINNISYTYDLCANADPNPSENNVLNVNENYILHSIFTKPFTKLEIENHLPVLDDKIENVKYYNGLGKLSQTIDVRQGTQNNDIISQVQYDEYGRLKKEFLPYPTSNTGDGKYRPNSINEASTFYHNRFQAQENWADINSVNPYTEKFYEASSLDRVIESAYPGKDWARNNGHTVKFDFQTNLSQEVRKYDVVFPNSNTNIHNLDENSFYDIGQLYKTTTKNENWTLADGKNKTIEIFKDKNNKTILQREFNGGLAHNTYYVYDIYGNLSYVIPPTASDTIEAQINTNPTATLPNTLVQNICYVYRHDKRKRIVEKKIPGKGWEYIIYDKHDRPVLSQSPNLRTANKWNFIKYDVYDRAVFSGQFTYNSPSGNIDTALREELQSLINNNIGLNETRTTQTFQNGGIAINYTNANFPNASNSNFTVFTVNYYDDYNFKPYGQSVIIPTQTSYVNTIATNVKTLSTATLTRVLGQNHWIFDLGAFDNLGREVWHKSKNTFLQTEDLTESKHDFTGNVIESKMTHTNAVTSTNLVVINKYVYDKSNRLLKSTQKSGNNPEELIVFNKYDELGTLIQKKVGGPAPSLTDTYNSVTTMLQTIDYSFNIRGWLTTINNPADNINNSGRLFAYKLNYNKPESGATALYNGNISETSWKTKSNANNQIRKYNYTYDALNRLTQSSYIGNYTLVANSSQIENYSEGNIQYDKNGNITHLERYGLKSTGNLIDKIDNLNYIYEPGSDKLKQVTDSGAIDGFKDLNAPNNIDYTYDANGNMITDINKGITAITYNHLNLPEKITFQPDASHPNTISYTYDAFGNKITKTVHESKKNQSGAWLPTTITRTDYANGFIYENNVLQFFSHPEGYVAHSTGTFSYIYQYKDHLGNIRLSYKKNASNLVIIEENNYYSFGLKHKGYNNVYNPIGNTNAQKYKYNGKELQEELGLNMYDYSARNYDPALGRWMNIDPLAEKFFSMSPYTFCNNNPLYFVDPTGMAPDGWIEQLNSGGNSTFTYRSDIDNAQQAKDAGFENVVGVTESHRVWNDTYGYSYNLNADGSVTNGQGYTMDNRFDLNTLGGTSIKASNPLGAYGFYNFNAGIGFTALEHGSGITRIGTNATFYTATASGRVFYGNQYVSTFGLSKIGTGLGYLGAGAGLVFDGIGVYNYYQNPNDPNAVSPAKASLNTGMAAYGLWGGPGGLALSLGYGALEAFYPGGAAKAMEDTGKRQVEFDRIINKNSGMAPQYIFPYGSQKF